MKNKEIYKKRKSTVMLPSRQVWCYYLGNSFQRAFTGQTPCFFFHCMNLTLASGPPEIDRYHDAPIILLEKVQQWNTRRTTSVQVLMFPFITCETSATVSLQFLHL